MSPSTTPRTPTSSSMVARKSGSNILSQKVARALQVQTDTPAMTAALEALSNLPSSNSTFGSTSRPNTNNKPNKQLQDKNKGGNVIDARSVRAAIEQDALQQAILFQSELKGLVQTVTDLRESVTNIKIAASRVSTAIEADAVCSPLDDQYDQRKESSPNGAAVDKETFNAEDNKSEKDFSNSGQGNKSNTKNGLQEEQNLALLIADAFRARNEAAYRAQTVKNFLEKFDLSDNDNYLLDHYAFEEFDHNNLNPNHPAANKEHNGESFLQALKRVRNIREQLKNTFDTETFVQNHNEDDDGHVDSEFLKNLNPHHTASSYSYNRLGATSALRMMETLATKQERAYERLYNWLQTFLHLNEAATKHVPTSSSMQSTVVQHQQSSNLDEDDDDLMDESLSHPFVKNSMVMLKYVPAYYNHILELISMQRRSEVTRRFLLALTSGYNGMTPIEVKAHDPVNYVGDMLAFIFRAFSVELDLARGIFSADDSNLGDENAELYEDDQDESTLTATSLLSHAMSGVTRPLKSRISQVVASLARRTDDDDDDDPGRIRHERRSMDNDEMDDAGADIDEEATSLRNRISALYSICGLLLFYHGALEKSESKLGKVQDDDSNNSNTDSDVESSTKLSSFSKFPVIESIQDCLEEASVAYAASVRVYAAMLDSFAALTSNESESTLAHNLIVHICDVRITSPGFAEFSMSDRHKKIESTLSLEFVCDTLIDSAMISCSSLEDSQALKNAITVAKKAGMKLTRCEHWQKALDEREVKMVEEIIQMETDNVLRQCGLGGIWEAFQRVEQTFEEDKGDVMTRLFGTQPDLSQETLQVAMKDFYESLYAPPLPSFDGMKDAIARKNARVKTAANVAHVYRRIYEGVKSERGGYEDLSFLGHHPDQVKTLLSL